MLIGGFAFYKVVFPFLIFSPNGAVLIYATRDRGRGVLATVTSDGRIQQQIDSGAGDVREPVWGPFPRP